MKELKKLVILSGKGGTGKTTLSAAFAHLSKNKTVIDCDVDAADLHLLFNPQNIYKKEFIGGKKAFIDSSQCTKCGLCESYCRFNAIHNYKVDQIACEGCGFCYRICPDGAIRFDYSVSGHYYNSKIENDETDFHYAKLLPGEGNSGKLVTELKKTADEQQNGNVTLQLIDGPPGIGCPVNASVSQMDFALIVTEPTLSGLHDLKRIVELTQQFNVPAFILINKYDLNFDVTKEIKMFAEENNITVIGKISFDTEVIAALQHGKSILEYPESIAAGEINSIWRRLQKEMEN
ncbi:ATP-binding protein [Bacteroidota bacterium]